VPGRPRCPVVDGRTGHGPAHDCLETEAAELLVDFGAVVVVVVVGVVVVGVVVAVVVGVVAVDAAEGGVVVVVVEGAAVVEVEVEVAAVVDEPVDPVVVVATVDEWAVVPDATRRPRPAAPADAATAIPVVARRTLLMARSREWAAGTEEVFRDRGCDAMVAFLGCVRDPVRDPALRWSMGSSQRIRP